jgi:hypothetical protein
MEAAKRQRIVKEWDRIVNQDNLSDEEAICLVAERANVTYGEARDVLYVSILQPSP